VGAAVLDLVPLSAKPLDGRVVPIQNDREVTAAVLADLTAPALADLTLPALADRTLPTPIRLARRHQMDLRGASLEPYGAAHDALRNGNRPEPEGLVERDALLQLGREHLVCDVMEHRGNSQIAVVSGLDPAPWEREWRELARRRVGEAVAVRRHC
jgi:hypothetical protein